MTKAAFIVEGRQEQLIINRICPNSKVVLLGANGDQVSMKAIADRIAAHTQVMNNRYYPIIVIFDRERRRETTSELTQELLSHMKKKRLTINQFIIGIADRSIEAWITPFFDEDGNHVIAPVSAFDGQNCIAILKRRLRKKNILYHKTTNGVDLFCKISPTNLSKISGSFKELSDAVKPHCSWINIY